MRKLIQIIFVGLIMILLGSSSVSGLSFTKQPDDISVPIDTNKTLNWQVDEPIDYATSDSYVVLSSKVRKCKADHWHFEDKKEKLENEYVPRLINETSIIIDLSDQSENLQEDANNDAGLYQSGWSFNDGKEDEFVCIVTQIVTTQTGDTYVGSASEPVAIKYYKNADAIPLGDSIDNKIPGNGLTLLFMITIPVVVFIIIMIANKEKY